MYLTDALGMTALSKGVAIRSYALTFSSQLSELVIRSSLCTEYRISQLLGSNSMSHKCLQRLNFGKTPPIRPYRIMLPFPTSKFDDDSYFLQAHDSSSITSDNLDSKDWKTPR